MAYRLAVCIAVKPGIPAVPTRRSAGSALVTLPSQSRRVSGRTPSRMTSPLSSGTGRTSASTSLASAARTLPANAVVDSSV